MVKPIEPNDPGHSRARKLTQLLIAAPDATLVVDANGRIMAANPQAEKLFGFSRGAMVGVGVEELMPEARRDVHRAHRAAFARAPRIRAMADGAVLVGRRCDGSEFAAEVSLNPLLQGTTEPWVVAGIRDVSERRQREQLEQQNERLAEASRLKTQFLANMSHELRTPLNAILGFAQLLHDEEVGPLNARQHEFLADILTGARHLLSLINGMLDLASIEAGRMKFSPTRFAPRELLAEVLGSVRLLASKKSIALSLQVEPALDVVHVDALKLKQVVLNFLSNAIKFTPEGGRVEVRARTDGQESFRIEVADTGPGIGPTQLQHLFVEFQQLDFGLARGGEGTGLGLALCKGIVEAQGGCVGVSSVVGEGSVFFAVLPRSTSRAQP